MNDMAKIKNTTFISSYENGASSDYCDRMVSHFKKLESTTSSWSGAEQNGSGNRRDFSFLFDESRNDAEDLQKETNEILNKNLAKYIEEHPCLESSQFYSKTIKVQKTPPKSGFHQWHFEQFVGESATRILTWTIYLNDIPEGEGETEFLEYGLKVRPKKGTVLFFPASWTHTHRGNAMYTMDKYIATGWYYLIDNGTGAY